MVSVAERKTPAYAGVFSNQGCGGVGTPADSERSVPHGSVTEGVTHRQTVYTRFG